MAGLNTSLSVATQSLLSDEAEISVTNNNIANAKTPGYSRETVLLSENSAIQQDGVSLGDGATLQGFSSVRDQLLNLRIQQQTSEQSSADAQAAGLAEVQTLFPSTGESLSTNLSTFFTSVSALSSNPTSAASRQTVLSSAQNLASQFNTVANGLATQQSSLNNKVSTDVAQINSLTSQIASLNTQMQQSPGVGQNNGPLQDQVGELEVQLSQLTGVSITHTEGGDTLTTGNGTPLVLGNQSYALSTKTDASGNAQVLDANGATITSTLTSGDLGGTLKVRDTDMPLLQGQLDTLANQFGTAINTAQAAGYDQNGNAGAALFILPSTVTGSAAAIKVATTDPAAIAASSDGSSGSNGNVAKLTAVETTKLASGLSPADTSANLVYQVGSLASKANAQSSAIGLSLSQLKQQQSSASGVSIDEESANLIQYQQSYEAAARVISTISSLFSVTLNMGTSGGY